MDKNYDNIIHERANHVFEVMAQRVSAEELTRIKAAFELVRETFASNAQANGEPYCLEILDLADMMARDPTCNANHILAVILYPMYKYNRARIDCIRWEINDKVLELIHEAMYAESACSSEENWSDMPYLPELYNWPGYPYDKVQINETFKWSGSPATESSIKKDEEKPLPIDYNDCTSFQDYVDRLLEGVIKRTENEVSETREYELVQELFNSLYEEDVVGKYGLIVKTLIREIEPDPTQRFVEAVAYARDGGYKAESFMAKGTKQEILAAMHEEDFPIRLNSTYARLQNMLEDL